MDYPDLLDITDKNSEQVILSNLTLNIDQYN